VTRYCCEFHADWFLHQRPPSAWAGTELKWCGESPTHSDIREDDSQRQEQERIQSIRNRLPQELEAMARQLHKLPQGEGSYIYGSYFIARDFVLALDQLIDSKIAAALKEK
jgi:hypothetical protein